MTTGQNGGPAFPGGQIDRETWTEYPVGMSLRDYFAAQIVAGFFTDRSIGFYTAADRKSLAQSAYEIADAMLAARASEGTQS